MRMRLSITLAIIPMQKSLATIPTQKIRRLYLKQTLSSEKEAYSKPLWLQILS